MCYNNFSGNTGLCLAGNFPDHQGFGLQESELLVSGLPRIHSIPLVLLVTCLHNCR